MSVQLAPDQVGTMAAASPRRGRSRRGSPVGVPVLVILATLIAAFSLVPLGYVAVMAVTTGWANLVELVVRPRVGELLLDTILLVACVVPLTLVLGVAGAWLVVRTDLAGRRWWALALAAPLAVPAFVNSYAWVSVIPSLGGLGAGVFITALSYFPLVYIPCVATLARLDPALEESAAALGMSPPRVFARVVLPQLRVAMSGGALLVGLHLLAEYGAFALLRFDTFTTAIMVQFQSTFNGAAGNALAGVLVLLCLLLLVVEARSRGNARYAKVGSGGLAATPRQRLGRGQYPAQLALAGLIVLAVGVPLLLVVRWVLRGGGAVWSDATLLPALGRTLGYGAVGAVVTTVVAFPMAYLVVRRPSRLTKTLELSNYLTSCLPGIVVGLAFVTVSIRAVPGLYQTAAVLIAAYVLLYLPRALVSLRAGLSQAPRELEEAAMSLGKPQFVALLRITLRLSAPAAAGGAALVFLAVINELTATLMLAPNGTRTLATEFWSRTSEIDYVGAAPYALLIILLSAPVTYLLLHQTRKAAGQ